ncbi:MAG: hypothetical protein EAY81_02270, partial [Bacteroidetes bacterium]
LLSLVGNVFQYKNNKEDVQTREAKIDTLVTVQGELEKELVETNKELESYRGISANLDSLLNDANSKIAAQEAKINKLISGEKNQSKLNQKLKKELAELRKLKDQYLEKIDQLITENAQLKKENEEKAAAITQLNEEKSGLQNKVLTASQLQAEYIKVNSFKKKGSGKYVETSLAKRTNKIEVSLTVMDNKVADPGDKMVYVVIKEPGGKTLAGLSKATFASTDGEEVSATASYKINYTGQKQEVKVNYESEERELVAGNYTIDVYIDGTLVNTSTYILR